MIMIEEEVMMGVGYLTLMEWLEQEVPTKNPLAEDIVTWFYKQAEIDRKYFIDEYNRYKDRMILKQDYE